MYVHVYIFVCVHIHTYMYTYSKYNKPALRAVVHKFTVENLQRGIFKKVDISYIKFTYVQYIFILLMICKCLGLKWHL